MILTEAQFRSGNPCQAGIDYAAARSFDFHSIYDGLEIPDWVLWLADAAGIVTKVLAVQQSVLYESTALANLPPSRVELVDAAGLIDAAKTWLANQTARNAAACALAVTTQGRNHVPGLGMFNCARIVNEPDPHRYWTWLDSSIETLVLCRDRTAYPDEKQFRIRICNELRTTFPNPFT